MLVSVVEPNVASIVPHPPKQKSGPKDPAMIAPLLPSDVAACLEKKSFPFAPPACKTEPTEPVLLSFRTN